jgi:hypothetical protein
MEMKEININYWRKIMAKLYQFDDYKNIEVDYFSLDKLLIKKE